MKYFAFPCGEKYGLKSIESLIVNDEQSHQVEILVRLYDPYYKPRQIVPKGVSYLHLIISLIIFNADSTERGDIGRVQIAICRHQFFFQIDRKNAV